MIGQTISHYRVLELLGEGGMGTVFKAEDVRLHRLVALKFVKAVASDRFEREARAVSALNHPNIAMLYDVGVHEGQPFLAMEFVDGRPLKGPIAWSDAVKLAAQIADAMAAAHGAGIVHRDLKPGNILVTPQGVAKVLDFGLARLAVDAAPVDMTHTARTHTAEGTLLGTVAYMSPEQAEGRKVDARSDIFSFGAVLYELLTGRRAFEGRSGVSTLSAILHSEPAPIAGVPAEMERLLRRCLRKDPGQRLQHMDDVKVLLSELAEEPGTATTTAAGPRQSWSRWPWAAAVLAVSAASAVVGLKLGSDSSSPPEAVVVRKYELGLGADPSSRGGYDSIVRPVLSPDGRNVAYSRNGSLWIRSLDRLSAREIPGTEGAIGPFWSPDSAHVAFPAGSTLQKLDVASGAVTRIGDLPPYTSFTGGTWSRAGTILVGFANAGLFEVPAQGGRLKLAFAPDRSKGEWDFHTPHYLPDGKAYLYTLHPAQGTRFAIFVRDGRMSRRLIDPADGVPACAVYDPRGYLVYERLHAGKTILAVPFSTSRQELTGEPFVVAESAGGPSLSRDGTLLHVAGGSARPQELVILDRQGKIEAASGEGFDQIRHPVFSPDATRVAFSGNKDGNPDIWVYDRERHSHARITTSAETEEWPAWSPDGGTFALRTGFDQGVIGAVRSDGSGTLRQLSSPGRSAGPPTWTPDGANIVFNSWPAASASGPSELWLRPVDGATPRLIASSASPVNHVRVSPNGKYLAFASGVSGRSEVYVRPFPAGEGRWQVSTAGGVHPRWNRRGDELFFVAGTALMSVAVTTAGPFRAGVPVKLFDGDDIGVLLYSFAPGQSAFDVSPDGQHVVAVRFAGGSARESAVIIENWLNEFRAGPRVTSEPHP